MGTWPLIVFWPRRLGRELGVPMRLANMAFAEMTEALNRGWENRDSRSPALLQLERCGLKVEVILSVFKRSSTAISRTMVAQSAGKLTTPMRHMRQQGRSLGQYLTQGSSWSAPVAQTPSALPNWFDLVRRLRTSSIHPECP